MTTALQILAGLTLTGTFLVGLTVLLALTLGRMITRDEEQRGLERSHA